MLLVALYFASPSIVLQYSYYLKCWLFAARSAIELWSLSRGGRRGGGRVLGYPPCLCIASSRKNCGVAILSGLDSVRAPTVAYILTLIERGGYWSDETSAWRFRRVDRWTCKGGNRYSTDMALGNKAMWTCHLEVCPSCCRRRKSNLQNKSQHPCYNFGNNIRFLIVKFSYKNVPIKRARKLLNHRQWNPYPYPILQASTKLFLFPKWTRHAFSSIFAPSSQPLRIGPTSISRNQIKLRLFYEGTYRNFLAELRTNEITDCRGPMDP